jgi:hypothetical protein
MSAVVDALEPLLALDDCTVGPFVYVAPPETVTNGDEAAVGKGGSGRRGGRRRSSGEGAAAAVVRPEE